MRRAKVWDCTISKIAVTKRMFTTNAVKMSHSYSFLVEQALSVEFESTAARILTEGSSRVPAVRVDGRN